MNYTFENLTSKQRSGEIYRLSENSTPELEQFLLNEFSAKENLTGVAFGFVTVSWIIALVLLEKGTTESVIQLKKLVYEHWNKTEIEDFKWYISNSPLINKNWKIIEQ